MTAPTTLHSIQGELEDEPADNGYASEGDVDKYVDEHDEGVSDCRMERRHPFPLPRNGAEFSEVDEYGNFIAKYTCPRCRLAYRREVWRPIRKGRRVRYTLLDATVAYKRGPNGESYLLPSDFGKMKPSQVRESRMTKAMEEQTPGQIKKAIAKMQVAS